MVTQADKVFAAEDNVRFILGQVAQSRSNSFEFLNSQIVLEPVVRFGDVDAARLWTERVAAVERLSVRTEVMKASSISERSLGAITRNNTISFNKNARDLDQLLALHELAHIEFSSHDSGFQNKYVSLVNDYIGPGVALVLRHELSTSNGKSASYR